MNKNKLEIGILYLGLHNQLLKKYGVNRIISNKEFFCKLGKHGQIPKRLRWIVIKEMEKKGLIKKVGRDNIQIISFEINLENDINKIYRIAGLY